MEEREREPNGIQSPAMVPREVMQAQELDNGEKAREKWPHMLKSQPELTRLESTCPQTPPATPGTDLDDIHDA